MGLNVKLEPGDPKPFKCARCQLKWPRPVGGGMPRGWELKPRVAHGKLHRWETICKECLPFCLPDGTILPRHSWGKRRPKTPPVVGPQSFPIAE